MRQGLAVETRALITDYNLHSVDMNPVNNVDELVRSVSVAPFDRIVTHFHQGLTKL